MCVAFLGQGLGRDARRTRPPTYSPITGEGSPHGPVDPLECESTSVRRPAEHRHVMIRVMRRWLRPLITWVALLAVYYTFPVGEDSDHPLFLGVVVGVLGVVALAWAIAGQVRRQLEGGTTNSVRTLVTLLGLVVMAFSMAFFSLAEWRTNEMDGLETRTDALYFTMVTMATIGFGDIHAQGQWARGLVMVLIVFNFVFVGALVSILSGRVHERAEARAEARVQKPGRSRRN
jgi:voltage-gated potassium channel